MRRSCLLLLLTAACAGGAEPTAHDPLPVPTFRLSGVVRDSVLGVPVAAVHLLLGDTAAVTDTAGYFTLQFPAGEAPLLIADPRFEPYAAAMSVFKDSEITLLLRGQAPYVTSCAFQGDSVSATIVDLQGRKTVNRRAESYLVARSSQAVIQNDANSWHWNAVDNVTWRTNVPIGGLADSVDWQLEDADGNARLTRCTRQAPPCLHCGG